MATSVFFNGRVISVPGSYSEVDPTGLESVGLGATGIVAMLGTAEGGRPVSTITDPADLLRLNKPQDNRNAFRSGDLKEAGGMLFQPSSDPNILSGAQQIVVCKVNPATQSAASFANAQGNAMDVLSRDYGAFTEQINVSIGDGTNQGKLVTIIFEDITEAFDDVGGDNIFTLDYETDAQTWDTMDAAVAASGQVTCAGSRAETGLVGDVANAIGNVAAQVESANAGDVGQVVTLYGLSGGLPVQETLTLNGTTPVVGTVVWDAAKLLGAKITGTTAGAVTVDPSGGGADVFVIPAGTDPSQGLVRGRAMFVANATLGAVLDVAGTEQIILVGKNAAGATQLELFTMNGTTSVPGVSTWSEITEIILGELPGGSTLTLAGTAAQTNPAVQKTVTQAADFFNAKSVTITGPATRGFIFAITTSRTGFLMADLDTTLSAVSIVGTPVGFTADLFAVVEAINSGSQLISAVVATGATGSAPDNTTAPVFLSGGGEGTTTFAEWQAALDLLTRIRVNTIVATTGDPAVHAAIEAHCAYMSGVGRSERDAKLGALNGALDDVPTKAQFKQQAVDLNSRHTQLVGQAIERFSTEGVRSEFLPPFTACVAAGMQAGSPVGTALTFKFADVLGFRQDASWNPQDDGEELINSGLLFLQNVDGVGRRWVRGVTTHLSSNNLAFIEASVNEAANFAAFNFRNAMEILVGQPGFSGTINAARGIAITQLGLQVDAGVLVGYNVDSLTIELVLDVLEVAVEIAPVIPINFVTTVLHLITAQQLAA